MIFKNWLVFWLENYKKPTCKMQTYERYKQIIEKHLISTLGKYKLDDLTPLILQQYIRFLLNKGNLTTSKGLAANTVNCVISVIQSSLKTACILGYCQNYVADKIVRPKIIEKQVTCFSPKEQTKIEKYILSSNRIKFYGIILCLYSGVRVGELLALTTNDIDFKKSTMTISKTCYYNKKVRVVDTPKTTTSFRVIPLPKQILPIIRALKNNSNCEYLITGKGGPVSVRSYQKSFELILKKLNIEHKGFHALRHTFATRALECGMDVKTLSEILGHKNPTVTLNRYVHSMFEHKRNMMNKLGKNLKDSFIE